MKELSTEQKAKRYDEVIVMAKECITHIPDEAVNKYMLNMFPELQEKESEDERIRKALISVLKSDFENDTTIYDISVGDIIAWLEKQGEQKSVGYIKDEILSNLLNKVICYFINNPDIPYSERNEVSVKLIPYVEMLEKQGEHANFCNKIQIGDEVTRNEDGVLVNLSQLKRVAKKDEKQGDYKPTDKVEPKFKVGDFIVNDYCRGKVVELTNDAYLLDTGQRIPFSCEHNIHHWTIQDAKDGDILVEECIFMLKKTDYIFRGMTKTYCSLYEGDFDCGVSLYIDIDYVKPATKEQRDLLFQKMKEAGYKWDADKKELIKL